MSGKAPPTGGAAAAVVMASSSGGLPEELQQDGKAVGAKVRVVTSAQESFEGVIFTVDPVANFLILGATDQAVAQLSHRALACISTYWTLASGCGVLANRLPGVIRGAEERAGSKSKTRIFQMEALQNIEVLEAAPEGVELALPAVSEEELQRVEQRNKGIAERALASIGQGVSSEAQATFDALNKTMPCEWEGANIRVMDDVVIKPPYQPQNCVSANTQVLSRVKKVVGLSCPMKAVVQRAVSDNSVVWLGSWKARRTN
ncbi:hypothetical protein BBJ28_00017360 [Nothophytophthora sp. Chile5]|nr:hypothetical protein BBJ28_00017360 [Nothophytophthora sp. Chile5]